MNTHMKKRHLKTVVTPTLSVTEAIHNTTDVNVIRDHLRNFCFFLRTHARGSLATAKFSESTENPVIRVRVYENLEAVEVRTTLEGMEHRELQLAYTLFTSNLTEEIPREVCFNKSDIYIKILLEE